MLGLMVYSQIGSEEGYLVFLSSPGLDENCGILPMFDASVVVSASWQASRDTICNKSSTKGT
jgi:hypothetical protein